MSVQSEIAWKDLHDAIVEDISVTWGERAIVRIRLLPNEAYIKPRSTVKIEGKQLRRLECPQENPWGPSNFVNDISETANASDEFTRIEIEMQSGDVIVVEAASFVVTLQADAVNRSAELPSASGHITTRSSGR